MITGIGFAASLLGLVLYKQTPDTVSIICVISLTLISLVNLFFLYALRTSTIVSSKYMAFFTGHHEITHIFKKLLYRVGTDKDIDLDWLLEKFKDVILKELFLDDVTVTIKYKATDGKTFYSIRHPNDAGRDQTEDIDESHIFNTFFERNQLRFCYVRDVDNMTPNEEGIVINPSSVKARARKHGYNTFVAFPINEIIAEKGASHVKETIGILGIDSPMAYSLGHIDKLKIDNIAIFVDQLSRLIKYVQLKEGEINERSTSNGECPESASAT